MNTQTIVEEEKAAMSNKRKKVSLCGQRKKRTVSVAEKVDAKVRSIVMNDEHRAYLRTGPDRENFDKHFKRYHRVLLPVRGQEAELSRINEDIGVGVFSMGSFRMGHIFESVWGSMGRRISPEESVGMRSTVYNHESHWHQLLLGPISFVNHACDQHANCVARWAKPDDKHDYKYVQAGKNISEGEELTITYADEVNLACRDCN